ncbi:MAG TPA: tricarballylate utilization 4Fe-4S protein TcuB [Bryobacteraceae bacterium]|nr:tricarballylate utilization 4Fe-4S protein TcuB [Bryobacteraceae bacterium]
MPQTDPHAEGARLLTICNSCRYCEGFCAVFPAMERRLHFAEADLNYLANLCHNCAECFYACQYAPPHEFAVNIPKVLAEIRAESYQKYSWPGFLRGAWTVTLLALVLTVAALAWIPRTHGGDFYAAVPHGVMVGFFGTMGLLVLAFWAIGLARFWNEDPSRPPFRVRAFPDALRDIVKLSNLSSHGAGCTYPNARHSQARRMFHHFTFYGFLLCFASTSVAAAYDNFFGWKAPYDYLSVPVVLGALGGLGLIMGPLGLLALKMRRDPRITDARQDGMDILLLALLVATAVTGLALMALRATTAMSPLLAIHLAAVSALFVSLPLGKFVHGLYRSAALLRNALEQRDRDENEKRGER